MIKRIAIGAVAVVLGIAALSWAGFGSYTATAWSNLRQSCKKQVPLEFEIDRVRHEVAQLVPDMKKNCRVIAEEMVAIENLKDEIATTKTTLKHQKDNIQVMTRDLDSGAERVVYGDEAYSRSRISDKLERDFASYKRCAAELKSKEQLLEAKQRALEAAREQLASMRSQKQDLEVQIEQLEADLKTVRLAQTRDKFQVDDSRLAQCKATLADIRTRLKVEQKTSEMHAEFANDPIPVEKKAKSVSDLTGEVKAFMTDKPAEDGKVVVDRN